MRTASVVSVPRERATRPSRDHWKLNILPEPKRVTGVAGPPTNGCRHTLLAPFISLMKVMARPSGAPCHKPIRALRSVNGLRRSNRPDGLIRCWRFRSPLSGRSRKDRRGGGTSRFQISPRADRPIRWRSPSASYLKGSRRSLLSFSGEYLREFAEKTGRSRRSPSNCRL